MNAGKEKNRVQYFDIARGIAMICIILGHLNNSLINRVVFTFHVPIFFFISGYFMNSKCGIKDYARNKLRTFDVNVYKEKNADLQNAFGNNLTKYYEHYRNTGWTEGRTHS